MCKAFLDHLESIEDERRCSQRSEGRPRSCSESMIQSFAMTWVLFFCRLGGWGWLQDQGWARARSLLRRPKRKEKRWDAHFLPLLLPWGGWREIRISCISPGAHCMILYIAQIIRGVSGFPVFLPSIQNEFQILPVEDNWEKGVRQEFRPFSSEISSQVSRSALLDLIPSIFVLGLPSLPPCVNEDVGKYHLVSIILPGVCRGGREGG